MAKTQPFDILGKLPLELAVDVVKYLHPFQIFQARRVSHKWKERLTSPVVLRPVFKQWMPSDQTIPEDEPAQSQFFTSVAKQTDAYETGLPFSIKYGRFTPDIVSMTYGDGMLAWVTETEPQVVKIHVLQTNTKMFFRNPNEQDIIKVAISASMIAITEDSPPRAHIWKFPLDPRALPQQIDLSPSKYPAIPLAAKQTLLLLQEEDEEESHKILTSYSYEVTTNIVHTWDTSYVGSCHGPSAILAADGRSIYYTEPAWDVPQSRECLGARLVRRNLRGHSLASWIYPDCSCGDEPYGFVPNYCVMGVGDTTILANLNFTEETSTSNSIEAKPTSLTFRRLYWDSSKDSDELRLIEQIQKLQPVPGLAEDLLGEYSACTFAPVSSLAGWGTIFYCVANATTDLRLLICDLASGTYRVALSEKLKEHGSLADPEGTVWTYEPMVVHGGQFIFLEFYSQLAIVCFDERVKMTGATYLKGCNLQDED